MTFGQYLKQCRQKANLSQGDVADLFEVTAQFVSVVERGVKNLPLSWVKPLAKLYGVPYTSMVKELEKEYIRRLHIDLKADQ